jgi:hypothetical protein
MTSNLNQSVAESYDSGLSALSVEFPSWPTTAEISVAGILAQTNPLEIFQNLDRRVAYELVVGASVEELPDLLPLLSDEQFTALVDYEAWDGDRIAHSKIAKWLGHYHSIGPEAMVERFRSLDEEFQLGLLSNMIELVDIDAYENMGSSEQDQFAPLPCHTAFYLIKNAEGPMEECIENLIQSSLSVDIAYTYSLLAHAMSMPPNESEAAACQFRRARIEEDGFVSSDEAQKLFTPGDFSALEQKWRRPESKSTLDGARSPNLFDDVMRYAFESGVIDSTVRDQLTLRYSHLSNSLAELTKIQTDDVNGLKMLITYAKGLVSLALDELSGGNRLVATEILVEEHPSSLFRYAVSLVDKIRMDTIARLESQDPRFWQSLKRLLVSRKFGQIIWNLDSYFIENLGFENVELFKGLFNRFPMVPSQSTQIEHRTVFTPISSSRGLALLRQNTYDVIDALESIYSTKKLREDHFN